MCIPSSCTFSQFHQGFFSSISCRKPQVKKIKSDGGEGDGSNSTKKKKGKKNLIFQVEIISNITHLWGVQTSCDLIGNLEYNEINYNKAMKTEKIYEKKMALLWEKKSYSCQGLQINKILLLIVKRVILFSDV